MTLNLITVPLFGCSTVWMFTVPLFGCYYLDVILFYLNNKIRRLRECCLGNKYNDKTVSFEQFLEKDDSVSIPRVNIETLAIEMYKVTNELSPEIMDKILYHNLHVTSCFPIEYIIKKK